MPILSKTFCPLPWIHLATRPNGDVRVCCTANASGAGVVDSKSVGLVKKDNVILNLKHNTIEDIWNSEFMRSIRLQMLNDEIPSSCRKCFEEESKGISSKRNWETLVWKDRVDLSSIVDETKEDGSLPVSIPYFDLRLGNTCQLKCVMCSPHDSSSWIKDWKVQTSLYSIPELQQDQQWDSQWDYNWYNDSIFIESIKSQSSNIKEIYFAGGEPLLIPEHYKILEHMVSNGDSKNCILRYNSNGLELSNKLFELWSNFKQVKFNFSIDAFGSMNDYIRYPSRWGDVQQNLKLLDESPANIVVNMACAVQLLNILYLPELAQWKIDQKFKKINILPYGGGIIGLHLVYLPSYLNIKVLPKELKDLAAEKILNFINSIEDNDFITNSYGKERWNGIINYMYSEDWSHKLPITVNYLETCDKMRNTDFRVIFPELSIL